MNNLICQEFRAQNAITRCIGLAVRNLYNIIAFIIELHLKQPHGLGLKQPLNFNSALYRTVYLFKTVLKRTLIVVKVKIQGLF